MRMKMKTLIFNGSPRKNWNTHKLLEAARMGAEHAGSEVELIHLYDYTFHGCISCFACKVKGNRTNGVCARRDEITELLEKVQDADVLIFGTPVYLHGATAQFRAFLERVLFPVTSYIKDEKTGQRTHIMKRNIATGLIYTMNNAEALMESKHYPVLLGVNGELLQDAFGHNEILYVNDTLQFDNYAVYEADFFGEEHKKEHYLNQFPMDCKKACEMGKRLVKLAETWNG